jgi:hypothetical protein
MFSLRFTCILCPGPVIHDISKDLPNCGTLYITAIIIDELGKNTDTRSPAGCKQSYILGGATPTVMLHSGHDYRVGSEIGLPVAVDINGSISRKILFNHCGWYGQDRVADILEQVWVILPESPWLYKETS